MDSGYLAGAAMEARLPTGYEKLASRCLRSGAVMEHSSSPSGEGLEPSDSSVTDALRQWGLAYQK